MVCQGLEIITDSSIVGLLTYPSTCDPYFYGKIMGAFFIVIASLLFYADREKLIKSDMISSLGVSGLGTIFVSLIGTLAGIIDVTLFIQILVICMVFVVLWLLKKK